MNQEKNRRSFIKSLGLITFGASAGTVFLNSCDGAKKEASEAGDTTSTTAAESKGTNQPFFKISLAEWSLNKALFAGKFTNLDFPLKAKNDFGINAVEYVNQFFKDKAKDQAYLTDLKKRCDDNDITSVLIMVDGEGNLGELDQKKRNAAVDNHKKWVEAAKFLGCHSIRVNAYREGAEAEVGKAATDGLRALSEFAKPSGINVIVENHGSYSSKGEWLASVIKNTGMDNCGTLPDFGNFCIKADANYACQEWYDRYKGTEEMMPYAKGVSAKTLDFDESGNCVETDYMKMMKIVKDAGYTGYVGIEYEGSKLSEEEGIRATKALLERVGAAL